MNDNIAWFFQALSVYLSTYVEVFDLHPNEHSTFHISPKGCSTIVLFSIEKRKV